MSLPVLAAPLFDPGAARIEMEVPDGLTVSQIIARTLPDLGEVDYPRCRVMLVTAAGSMVLQPLLYHSIKPRPGVQVVIRVVPGKDSLKSVLTIVVAIAALAAGAYFAPMLAGTFGIGAAGWGAVITTGINVMGSLLINALIPPPQPRRHEERPSYSISGWRNRFEPGAAVPVVLGRMRYAPPFAATSYTEIVGDDQYVRALFSFGYGPVLLSEFRLGETSLSEFHEVDIEVREGRPDDASITLFPDQVAEENIGLALVKPRPRDEYGEVLPDQPGEETPIVRTTGDDAQGVSIIFAFPAGLVRMHEDGSPRSHSVKLRIRQCPAGTSDWEDVALLDLRAQQTEAFFRQHKWDLPTRGRWDIEVTRLTIDSTDATISDRVAWAALQTLRPEYPLNFAAPQALVALRIKATHQLNGALDNFSAFARAEILDYDGVNHQWIMRPTANPASIFRHILQCAANPRPVRDDQLDIPLLEGWHAFCLHEGLTYNGVLDDAGKTLRETLGEVAAAGRASPRHDGVRWGVTIDRPQDLIVDHISPRNSWGFRASRLYVEPPHGFRVQFADATRDYAPAERLISWPGYTGPVELTEQLSMPGKTDPAEIWREARRRMLEVVHRPDTYEVMQDGPLRVATRGDLVAVSHDVLDDIQISARVLAVHGARIVLDEVLAPQPGHAYGIRFRVFDRAEDTIGRSVVRTVDGVLDETGGTSALDLTGTGDQPQAGNMVLFGHAAQETRQMIVTGVEMTEDMACLVRLVDAAPEIDTELALMSPPVWTGRAGSVVIRQSGPPAVPRFRRIVSGMAAYYNADTPVSRDLIYVELRPGRSPVPTQSYRVWHRLAGETAWDLYEMPVADGGSEISGYTLGDQVEIKAQAVSAGGVVGASTDAISVEIGDGEAALPIVDTDALVVTPVPGGVRINFDNADPNTVRVQLYSSTTDQLDASNDAQGRPVDVEPARPVQLTAGDMTRRNILRAPSFEPGADWTAGGGWTVAAGVAQHTAGTDGTLDQRLALEEGRVYRAACTLSDVTAGAVTLWLGDLSVPSGPYGTNGRQRTRIHAGSASDRFELQATDAFSGRVDDALLYAETPACLPQGRNYFWLEPINSDGRRGEIIGPFTAVID